MSAEGPLGPRTGGGRVSPGGPVALMNSAKSFVESPGMRASRAIVGRSRGDLAGDFGGVGETIGA